MTWSMRALIGSLELVLICTKEPIGSVNKAAVTSIEGLACVGTKGELLFFIFSFLDTKERAKQLIKERDDESDKPT